MKIINIKISALLGLAMLLFSACSNYLNVVPDNVMKIENIFATKEDAYTALAKIYSYIPVDCYSNRSNWLLGDEYIGRQDAAYQNSADLLQGERIMRGLQTTGNPLLGYWDAWPGYYDLYQGITACNIFLKNIVNTRNMTETERKEWESQAKFLKAYYHFLLLQKYGPIVISDVEVSPEATKDDLFKSRSKVEDVYNYVIRLIDEAIPSLSERLAENDLGQVDKVAAMSIKARILVFRASPLSSGNKEIFGDFFDKDGQPFFPINDTQEQTKKKWEAALKAIDEALALAKINGKELYHYKQGVYVKDREFLKLNPEKMQTYYDLRMVNVDPWNEELLWGYSNVFGGADLAEKMNMRLPSGFEGDINNTDHSEQSLGATYRMTERYYTENGLPINEDLTYNYNGRHEAYTTPGVESLDYSKIAGIMQPNDRTINLYMNRELRFYANLGITGGYYRSHFEIIPVEMMSGTNGGYNPSTSATQYYCTGIGIQKLVHPESRSGSWQRQVRFPYPIIRMADLYLMRAEALNEVKTAPDAEVWEAINVVRKRAGIPDVQTVWSDASIARTVNKHTTKIGMRDIILQERSIELAFEGSRYWDMVRYKRAHIEFSTPIQGWNYKGTSPNSFFVLGIVESRRFTMRDYLWPITLNELNTNANIKQNPGW